MLFWTGPWLLKQDGRGGRYPAKSRLASTLFGMPTTKAENRHCSHLLQV